MINKLKAIPKFFHEIGEELKKVNWSSRREIVDAALLVIAMMAILTIYIFAIDVALAKGMEFLLK
jgi:preprotein translocase subunit SecE